MTRILHSRDAWAVGFLIAWPFIYFWQITLGQGVWFTRDVSRVYHPFAVELSRALSEGRLPLWTPMLQAGFPLFAEGQIAALYPLHLLMVKVFSPEFAISIETLLHLGWAAIGMYALVRGMQFMIPSALLAGIAFSFSGFMIQKVYHMPILWTAAWLPWLVFLLDQFQRARRDKRPGNGIWFLLTTLAMGVQWLSGSAQMALLNSMVAACVGFIGGLTWNRSGARGRERLKEIPRTVLWVALPLLLGGGLGAMQLLPTAELVGYSVRAGGLDEKLLTLYSYSADSLQQFIFPFSQGEPSDDNVELWGYVGITTLISAAAALKFRRDSKTVFFTVFALTALSLTLGNANPAFRFLVQMPVLNLFRVPARYVFLFGFATAFLAATTLEALSLRTAPPRSFKPTLGIASILTATVVIIIALAYRQSLEFWFGAWQFLPYLLAFLVAALVGLAWTRRASRDVLGATMVGLVLIDLAAYAAPFLSTTVARLTPPAYVNQIPRSAGTLGLAPGSGRILADESIWPSVPALRSSLYPNFGLVYERESVHIYSPLALGANDHYYFSLSPAMLNLMNARYFSVPLEPRLADRPPTPPASLAVDVVGKEAQFPPTPAAMVQIDSFAEDTSKLPAGSIAANVTIKLEDGSALTFPLQVGMETADWDWGQKHDSNAPPRQTQIAHPVMAFVRSAGHNFEGYVYRAQFKLDPPGQSHNVVAVSIAPVGVPQARLSIERVSLIDAVGHDISVAALTGKDDFALTYMSDTAAIWENLNVAPRAFVAHRVEVLSNDQIIDRLQDPAFPADQVLLREQGEPMSAPDHGDPPVDHVEITSYLAHQVSLAVTTNRSGYLFLGDTWYPGWNAFVDGKPTPIYLADYVFRVVPIEPGQHFVVFEYRPTSLILGAGISALSLIVATSIAWAIRQGGKTE